MYGTTYSLKLIFSYHFIIVSHITFALIQINIMRNCLLLFAVIVLLSSCNENDQPKEENNVSVCDWPDDIAADFEQH